MAYVRIHGIKTTLNKALDYIENPEKTEHQMLVSGYNVDPLSASIEFRMTAAVAKEVKGDYSRTGGADNLAYHMIQSFAPYDKITPEAAHELGKKWANEITGGKYEYVISTHVDKGHIHNHIIFNATSFLDFGKFNNYKVAGHLREVSDRLCEEQGLYVMNKSWQSRLKVLIDKAIKESTSFKEFEKELEGAGVVIKRGQRLSFRIAAAGQKHFTRGDRIGAKYSWAGINARLAANSERPAESYDQQLTRRPRWEQIADTKALAAALLTIRTEQVQGDADFGRVADELTLKAGEVQAALTELEAKSQQYTTAAKYLLAIQQNGPIKQEAALQPVEKRAWYSARYEGEISAYDYAAAQLEKMGVDINVDPAKVLELVKQQSGKAAELKKDLAAVQGRIDAIKKAHELVKRVQEPDRGPQRKEAAKDTQER